MSGTRKTKKAKVRDNGDGTQTYGPYKGSKQNDGRPTVVHYSPRTQKMGSSNAARDAKEKALGHKLAKNQHAAHSGTSNKAGNKGIAASATTVTSAAKNIGDGNRNRKKKK